MIECVCVRERETDRQIDRDRETETDRQTETDIRQKDGQTDRVTEKQRDR